MLAGSGTQDDLTKVEQAVPLFAVADMARSLAFYVDGLGFSMTEKWEVGGMVKWCWLNIGSAAVMLQEISPKWKPQGKLGVGVSINFICRDALALYREFRSRGVDAQRPFVGNGMWVTSLTDPDGYPLHFESKTDAPEESQFSD